MQPRRDNWQKKALAFAVGISVGCPSIVGDDVKKATTASIAPTKQPLSIRLDDLTTTAEADGLAT